MKKKLLLTKKLGRKVGMKKKVNNRDPIKNLKIKKKIDAARNQTWDLRSERYLLSSVAVVRRITPHRVLSCSAKLFY